MGGTSLSIIFAILSTILCKVFCNLGSSAYMGCYGEDERRRALNGRFATGYTIMTLDICRRFCFNGTTIANTYMYFGVANSSECFCGGDEYSKHGIRPETDCSSKCIGNPKQICGGPIAISVYTVCAAGFYGQQCTQRCHCRIGGCSRADGTCLNGGECEDGWDGQNCATDRNECKRDRPCAVTKPNSYCINTMGSFNCSCRKGFLESSDGQECIEPMEPWAIPVLVGLSIFIIVGFTIIGALLRYPEKCIYM